MTESLRIEAPEHAGSREQAQRLAATLPADLSGRDVLLDCGRSVVATPSFMDELVKQILVERGVRALEMVGAEPRPRELLERAAQNRSVRGRLRVAVQAH